MNLRMRQIIQNRILMQKSILRSPQIVLVKWGKLYRIKKQQVFWNLKQKKKTEKFLFQKGRKKFLFKNIHRLRRQVAGCRIIKGILVLLKLRPEMKIPLLLPLL